MKWMLKHQANMLDYHQLFKYADLKHHGFYMHINLLWSPQDSIILFYKEYIGLQQIFQTFSILACQLNNSWQQFIISPESNLKLWLFQGS